MDPLYFDNNIQKSYFYLKKVLDTEGYYMRHSCYLVICLKDEIKPANYKLVKIIIDVMKEKNDQPGQSELKIVEKCKKEIDFVLEQSAIEVALCEKPNFIKQLLMLIYPTSKNIDRN